MTQVDCKTDDLDRYNACVNWQRNAVEIERGAGAVVEGIDVESQVGACEQIRYLCHQRWKRTPFLLPRSADGRGSTFICSTLATRSGALTFTLPYGS